MLQEYQYKSNNPQRSMLAPNLPTPVRSLFSRVQARRDRPTPCLLFDGLIPVTTVRAMSVGLVPWRPPGPVGRLGMTDASLLCLGPGR